MLGSLRLSYSILKSRRHRKTIVAEALGIGLLSFALGAPEAEAAPVLPSFAGATFLPGAPIDNPYFQVTPNVLRVYTGQGTNDDGNPITQTDRQLGLNTGPTILGVQTRTVHDVVYQNGKLIESTEDHYAQDTNGNVWYMGEDSTSFEYDNNGNLTGTSHEGSWRGGVNGALPGFQMPSDLTVGFSYYQEFAQADDAVDQAQTFAVGKTITTALGTFPNILQVLETSAVEPDVREFKFYAPGVGLILDQDELDPNLENPKFQSQLTSLSVVPLPPALSLFASALATLGVGMIRRKKAV